MHAAGKNSQAPVAAVYSTVIVPSRVQTPYEQYMHTSRWYSFEGAESVIVSAERFILFSPFFCCLLLAAAFFVVRYLTCRF